MFDCMLYIYTGEDFRIDHSFLASPYHAVMIAGLSLIASNLESQISEHQPVFIDTYPSWPLSYYNFFGSQLLKNV